MLPLLAGMTIPFDTCGLPNPTTQIFPNQKMKQSNVLSKDPWKSNRAASLGST